MPTYPLANATSQRRFKNANCLWDHVHSHAAMRHTLFSVILT
jgi:hypothetical protein